MKNETSLKVFLLSQPLLHTEWLSLMGDKYSHSLPFNFEITQDFTSAQIVAWDGVMTPKSKGILSDVLASLKNGKVLLLQGEARTLLKSHSIVSQIKLDDLNYVELPGWSVLPEEIIAALEKCQQKLMNV